jgi:hypothetical protein
MKRDEDEQEDYERTKRELQDTKHDLNKTKKKLNGHLFWTYGIFWSILWVFLGALHFLAGAYMFFHRWISDMGIATILPLFNDFPYWQPALYFVGIWFVLFFVFFWIWGEGMKSIKKSLEV